MTKAQISNLGIGITEPDELTVLQIESALDWILANTTLRIDKNGDLSVMPAGARLFVVKFLELQDSFGVTSESIEGLSQSFETDRDGALWMIARTLLGPWLKGDVTFVPMKRGRRRGH